MYAVWKFPLVIDDYQEIEMPSLSKVLTVQTQGETPCIFALCETTIPHKVKRVFRIAGTGHPIDNVEVASSDYIGTFQQFDGGLVFHVFEVKGDEKKVIQSQLNASAEPIVTERYARLCA